MRKCKSRALSKAEVVAWKRRTRELADKTAQLVKTSERLVERLHELDGPALARLAAHMDLMHKIFQPERSAPLGDDAAES